MTTIEWFENICANIQSNERSIASAASNALEEFKESDIALTGNKYQSVKFVVLLEFTLLI